jgi:hypothetical protein
MVTVDVGCRVTTPKPVAYASTSHRIASHRRDTVVHISNRRARLLNTVTRMGAPDCPSVSISPTPTPRRSGCGDQPPQRLMPGMINSIKHWKVGLR